MEIPVANSEPQKIKGQYAMEDKIESEKEKMQTKLHQDINSSWQ